MYIKLRKGIQQKILTDAIKEVGSERKLGKKLGISNGSMYRYKFEKGNISKDKLLLLLSVLNKDSNYYKKHLLEELPNNWGQVKGGLNCVNKKKMTGKFEETIERLKQASSKRMKKWHREMKLNRPKQYHLLQYERFKKINGGYKYHLKNGVAVRNRLEKDVGDFLITLVGKFDYEPYMNIEGKTYFPDFKINNILLEVTEWKHPSKMKLRKLRRKLYDYKKGGFDVVLFVPEKLRKFYKEVECPVISALNEIRVLVPP